MAHVNAFPPQSSSGPPIYVPQCYLASAYGISPGNPDNTTAFNLLLAAVRASSYGGRIFLDPGPHDFGSGITDPGGSPVEIIGSGTDVTYLRCAGSLVSSGNLLAPKRYFRMFSLTLSSTSVRAAGSFVTVTGDMLIGDIPSSKLMNIEFVDVNMELGFNGVVLNDSGASKGVCGFFWDGGHSTARGFAAGGTVFDINTPNGVINTIQNVTHHETSGVAAGSRPAATVRARGFADLRLHQVESVYAVRGLVIDPPASGRAATLFASKCIWGQTTSEAVQIAPNATADCHSLQFVGGYVDIGGMSITGNAKATSVSETTFLGNTPNDALKLDAVTTGFTGNGLVFSGGNAKCVHALNSSTNFRIDGAFSNVTGNNTVGVHIEAGCDKYQVNMVGGGYCTTATNAPADDATKVCKVF